MGPSFSAPEYSLKVADVSKIRTLNAIARNTLWPGGDVETDSHDKSVKQIPQSWSQVILFIFPRRHFGGRLYFSRYCWLNLLELRDSISTSWDIQGYTVSQSTKFWESELTSVLNIDSEKFFFISQNYRTCWSVQSVVIFIIKDLANVAPTCTVTCNIRNIVTWFILL